MIVELILDVILCDLSICLCNRHIFCKDIKNIFICI
nr:MAG TPA: hypothetical protein [Caudoviricetes sp.]